MCKYKFNNKEELKEFVKNEVIDTTETCKILNCTRQNLNMLKYLKPIKVFPNGRIYFKDEVFKQKQKKNKNKN